MSFRNKLKQVPGSWCFFIVIVLIYFLFLIFNSNVFFMSLSFFSKIIFKIIPIFILVFVLMTFSNYFITPKFIMKHLREKGLKKWFFVMKGPFLKKREI